MTRAELEKIKAKAHGPDVDALIEEIERCWKSREILETHLRIQAKYAATSPVL